MGKKLVQQPLTKTYTNAVVLQLQNKTLTILEREAQNGCIHCIAILKEIFNDNKGSGIRTNETQTLTQNQPHQHSKQVLKIGKVKGTSAVDY